VTKTDSFYRTYLTNPAIYVSGLVLAAFIGGLASYGFTSYQQAQEVKERRHTLVTLLQQELAQIPKAVPPYDKAKAFYRDPLRLNAPAKLIDAETLQFHKDSRLITLLLNLNVVISRHNDFVEMTNLAQATQLNIPDSIHAQWYNDVKQRLADVVLVRDSILKELQSTP
jgi:hypothetical protein